MLSEYLTERPVVNTKEPFVVLMVGIVYLHAVNQLLGKEEVQAHLFSSWEKGNSKKEQYKKKSN